VDQLGDEVTSEVAARLSTAESRRTRVLVTGVGGFIGGFLARYLADHGYKVFGTARDRRRVAAEVRAACLAIHELEINGSSDWTRVLEGVDVVVHCAAHVHVRRPSGRDQHLFREVNVEGGRVLAVACGASAVRRLINLSSIAAVADPADEKLPGYGSSKRDAETVIAESLLKTDCSYLNLRLPAVYGPGGKGALAFLFRLVKSGLPLPMVTNSPRRSYLNVWNLGECICHCMADPSIKSGTVAIADGTPLSLSELIAEIAAGLGRQPCYIRMNVVTLASIARVLGLARETGRGMQSLVIDPTEARLALSWEPTLTAREAWARVGQLARV
jgi:nucleoside-diphosphate-sugar epimerase